MGREAAIGGDARRNGKEKMTDVTVRGGLMKGNVIPFTLKERNNGR